MNDFIKLTFVKINEKVCVRKADIVMFRDNKYREEGHYKSCTTVFLSKDQKDWIRVKEPVEEIMWMINHE